MYFASVLVGIGSTFKPNKKQNRCGLLQKGQPWQYTLFAAPTEMEEWQFKLLIFKIFLFISVPFLCVAGMIGYKHVQHLQVSMTFAHEQRINNLLVRMYDHRNIISNNMENNFNTFKARLKIHSSAAYYTIMGYHIERQVRNYQLHVSEYTSVHPTLN